jgi:hypothetical protein
MIDAAAGAEDGTNATRTASSTSMTCRETAAIRSCYRAPRQNGHKTTRAALPTGHILAGHEGNFSPDGLTWYSGDRGTPKKYTATDITTTVHPILIATWTLPQLVPPTTVTTHGLTVSDDGMRAYVSQAGVLGTNVDLLNAPAANGVLILDVSDVQKRLPNPQIRQVGSILWRDGGQMQHTIPVTINGHSYLVAIEESSTGGNSMTGYQAACAAGLPVFNMARILDISDETKPTLVSRLMLETHDPANCSKVLPDLTGLSSFTYGSHYCSVDNRHYATTLACGYFNSGIRVFDIREPSRPRRLLTSIRQVRRRERRVQSLQAKWAVGCRRPGLVQCPDQAGRDRGDTTDNVSGRRLPVIEVHQRRVAISH